MSRRRAAVAMMLALTLVLISSTGEARDRKATSESYERATGTVVTAERRTRNRRTLYEHQRNDQDGVPVMPDLAQRIAAMEARSSSMVGLEARR